MAKIASDKLECSYSLAWLAIIAVALLPVELAAQGALHGLEEESSSEAAAAGVQEAAGEVAEGTQNALNLRNLLLGRNYLFYGRVEGDLAGYSGDIPSSENGAELRRLRIGIAGLATFVDRLSYKAELDLSDGTNNFSDLYLQWDFTNTSFLRMGNQKVSQNLSSMTSSLSQLFMEEALPVTAFSLGRRLAVSYDVSGPRWGLHGMVFSVDPNNDAGDSGWAARFAVDPFSSSESVGHIGISAVSEKMDREARYRTRPESNVTDFRLVDTGLLQDVRYQHTVGLEMVAGKKSSTVRAEVFQSMWDRAGGKTNTFNGAYVEFGHILSGQHFKYNRGRKTRLALGEGETAWEMGLRISWVDLTSKDVQGGEQWNAGAAINYYRSQNLRFMVNLLRYRTDHVPADQDGWIFQARVQYSL